MSGHFDTTPDLEEIIDVINKTKNNMMTASEANVKAKEVRQVNDKKQIVLIENAINNAVNEGLNTVSTNDYALPDTVEYFKKLGYSIRNEMGREDCCIISW